MNYIHKYILLEPSSILKIPTYILKLELFCVINWVNQHKTTNTQILLQSTGINNSCILIFGQYKCTHRLGITVRLVNPHNWAYRCVIGKNSLQIIINFPHQSTNSFVNTLWRLTLRKSYANSPYYGAKIYVCDARFALTTVYTGSWSVIFFSLWWKVRKILKKSTLAVLDNRRF